MSDISFPNLGVDLELSKIALTVFGRNIAWYGIIVTLGIIAAVIYVYFRAKKLGIITDDYLDIAILTVVLGVVGARLYYVLTSLDSYSSVADAFKIWEGGLAIYGGIIGGALGAVIMLKIKKMNVIKFFDSLAPGVMLGQIIGRWGNFVNGEAYGSVSDLEIFGHNFDISATADFPWVMRVNGILCQPTFLYESVWNLIGFVLINIFYPKKKYDGEILLMYISWYGVGRFFIEGLRTDSLYIGDIKISQLLAMCCAIVGITLLIFFKLKNVTVTRPLYSEKEAEGKEDENGDNN